MTKKKPRFEVCRDDEGIYVSDTAFSHANLPSAEQDEGMPVYVSPVPHQRERIAKIIANALEAANLPGPRRKKKEANE